jgi:hypothetical protein
MTAEQDQLAAARTARNKNRAGLLLILVGGLGVIFVSFSAIGWWTVPLFASFAVIWVGWWLATADVPAGSPGTPGTPGTVVEIDTEHPDPGAFIPGRDTLGPGEFFPPPPSRDESRDLDRTESRDRR